jgi:hypothetical protein
MGEKDYFIDLKGSKACRIRVYVKTERGIVQDLVIQLEKWNNNQWSPVARYDCAHGELHIDVLRRDGSKEKRFMGDSNLNQAVTKAIEDLKTNWKDYMRRSGYEQEEDE